MNLIKKLLLALIIIVSSLSLILIAGVTQYLDKDKLLLDYVNQSLDRLERPNQKLRVEEVKIQSYKPLVIELKNLKMIRGRLESVKWEINVKSIRLHTTISQLRKNVFDKVEVEKIQTTLLENDGKLAKYEIEILKSLNEAKKELNSDLKGSDPKEKDNADPGPSMWFKKIKVKDSEFKYIKKDPKGVKHPGELHFQDISITTHDIEVKKSRLRRPIKAKAKGQLGNQKIKIEITLDSFKKNFKLTFKSLIEDADLSVTNTYFIPAHGFRVYGYVNKSESFAELQNRHLKVETIADYKGLKVDVLNNAKRNLVTSLIMDAVANMKICNSSQKKPEAKKQKISEHKQKDESAVQFLLRGLLVNHQKLSCIK